MRKHGKEENKWNKDFEGERENFIFHKTIYGSMQTNIVIFYGLPIIRFSLLFIDDMLENKIKVLLFYDQGCIGVLQFF